jgi:hypothetical protein
VVIQADLCVAGGGMAGVCAALAAARNGARVVLLQDRSVLGGNASSEIRMHIVGASCSGRRPGARESGIIDELRVESAVTNPQRSAAMFDLLLYDRVRREPNITLLLDTACAGCRVDDGLIRSMMAVRHSTEETIAIEAPFFSDCTGDGRLGAEAGADFRVGREAAHEYGETLAPPEADSRTLGSSILFSARRHDRPMPFAAPPWARRVGEHDLRLRAHPDLDYGYWWLEWGGTLDTLKDNPLIRDELLSIALGVWDHVKNRCPRPDAEDPANWALDWIGMLPGKRESRRFLGPHVLTEGDLMEGRTFPDDVAYGGWWIDLHPPAGIDAPDEPPCRQVDLPPLYGIPLRSLCSRNVANLFFAGRNISASHVAFASTRVMATCAVMGQAVGTAAAVAARKRATRTSDLYQGAALDEIQQTLLRDDAFLLGVRNADPADLARQARVRASSELPGSPAASVIAGPTRATGPSFHPSLERSSNQWASATLPARIELEWPSPRTVSEIQIIFDTGFHRELTLTQSGAYHRIMVWGPQPETVRDYRLAWNGGSLEGKSNYQRRRVHRLPAPVVTDRLALEAAATHGDPHARVFEIRVYS